MKRFWIATALLVLVAFAIPIEHKYDKAFRFFSLTLIPQGLEVSAQYDKKIYFYPSDIAALLLMGLGLFWYRIPPKRFFGHPLWLVFLCALLSIIASPFIHYPIAYSRLLQLLTPILLFSFVSFAFSDTERHKVTRYLFITLLTAALIQSTIGIAQYFHEGPLGLRLFGEQSFFTTIRVEDGTRWTLDHLFRGHLPNPIKIRATGTFPHANVLGGFLTLSILITYSLIQRADKTKWLIGLTLPFQFFALCITYSRSAFFAWCLGTTVWFVLVLWKQREKNLQFLASILTLSVALSYALLHNQIRDRGGIVNYNSAAQASDSIRVNHQNIAIQITQDHPLLGVGFSQFTERAQPYFPPHTDAYTRSTGPHNVYLFLTCETGLISLAAYLAFIFFLGLTLARTPITYEVASLAAIFIAFLFIGFCDFYPLLFQQGKLMFFLCCGLLASHCLKRIHSPLSQRVF